MAEKDMVQVSCDNCGKTYKIDPAKLTDGENVFKCKGCEKDILVPRPPASSQDPLPPPSEEAAPAAKPAPKPAAARRAARAAADTGDRKGSGSQQSRPIGLRGKMALLFLLVPIVLMTMASMFYLYQLKNMTRVISDESTSIVNRMSGELMAQYSRQVALQVKRYLEDHPFLKKEDFNTDLGFKLIAVQKVGLTGFTYLYAMPDSGDVWRIWAHVDQDIIGVDMEELKKKLGAGFEDYWSIVSHVKKGTAARGEYQWLGSDGRIHKNFIVATPVEGTEYVVVSSTPAVEFLRDVRRLETKTDKVANQTQAIILVILVLTIVLIGVIVAVYGARITGKIKSLTDAADRISVGDMDHKIDVESNDEIGDLAEAIGRMQESIRLSIDRLRRRRKR